ncbi:MAG: hypothetical protein IPJ81_07815 [Chitinophagaceae bacterium]|nr:hypothetical protein [Chitinophagaceae bacterium]
MGGFEYKNDTLQQVVHEEGRIRSTTNGQLTTFFYDYFIKDHLGNTRMVLTEEQQTDQYPLASMELAQNVTESSFYSKIPETRTIKPAGYPADATTNPNAYAAKVRGDGNKIGPGITLKVMAGDKFSIKVNSWYKTNGAQPQAATNPLNDLLTALTNGVGNLPGAKSSPLQLQQSAVFTPGATSFLNNQPAQGVKPKAYLNWVLFDEQFNFVQSSSGSELVGADNVFTSHIKSNLPVNKNGYLYIYVSNATPNIDVFFDNLQVTHVRGALLEESHYYPFGLQMAGISSKSAGKLQNKLKYNGIEETKELDLNQYDAFYRTLDPQIGRWWQIDPKIEDMETWSPYVSNFNNPITFKDYLGDEPEEVEGPGPATVKLSREFYNAYKLYRSGESLSGSLRDISFGKILENLQPFGQGGDKVDYLNKLYADERQATLLKSISAETQKIAELANEAYHKSVLENSLGFYLVQSKGTQNSKVKEALEKGNKAHKEFTEKAKAKGWTTPTLKDPKTGKTVKPDAVTKDGKPIELKPNTRSGKTKGARQLPKYERATGQKGRVITYDPSKITL